jgi:hypothetical protein
LEQCAVMSVTSLAVRPQLTFPDSRNRPANETRVVSFAK